ncbi:hypothetical protein QBS70_21450, partial [Cronobacter sakazakii]|nr:hypothetical protein [Cronobacter sakazakii]
AAIAPAGRNGVLETLPLDDAALSILDELAPQFSIADELTMRKSQRLTISGDTREALAFLLGSAVLNLSEIRTTPLPGRGIIPPARLRRIRAAHAAGQFTGYIARRHARVAFSSGDRRRGNGC